MASVAFSHCTMSPSVELRRARPLLGTYVEICARGTDELPVRRGLEKAFAVIAQVQSLMSFHEPTSDVSLLNRNAFRKSVIVHSWTWRVLTRAQEFALRSDGAFDITVAPLLSKWGYLPSGNVAHETGTFRDLLLQSQRRVRFVRPLSIDLGGIAKGFAVDRAVDCLQTAGVVSGSVNAGGDLCVFGDEARQVCLRDPARPGRAAGVVDLQNRAIATSGIYFTRKIRGGRVVSALIDGRTRRAHTRPRSVAVSAADCLTADALTKIVLAHGEGSCGILRAYQADAVVLERGKSPRVLTAHAPQLR
jgi:thiamine biosynthesis lipoprotein